MICASLASLALPLPRFTKTLLRREKMKKFIMSLIAVFALVAIIDDCKPHRPHTVVNRLAKLSGGDLVGYKVPPFISSSRVARLGSGHGCLKSESPQNLADVVNIRTGIRRLSPHLS
jgi:hypothetical protein